MQRLFQAVMKTEQNTLYSWLVLFMDFTSKHPLPHPKSQSFAHDAKVEVFDDVEEHSENGPTAEQQCDLLHLPLGGFPNHVIGNKRLGNSERKERHLGTCNEGT